MGLQQAEMLHRFGSVQDLKTADGGFCGVFEIEKIFERKFLEARGGESRELGASERPGHLAFWIGRFTAASDDKQEAARAEEPGNIFDRTGAKWGLAKTWSVLASKTKWK